MLIWQKNCKGTVKVRVFKSNSYVIVKREKLQIAIEEAFNKIHCTRKDCQELNTVYGLLAGLKAITLKKSNGKKNIEFYFNDESIWRHEPEVILTEGNELFDEFIKVVKNHEKNRKA